jgi:hypothetical protein
MHQGYIHCCDERDWIPPVRFGYAVTRHMLGNNNLAEMAKQCLKKEIYVLRLRKDTNGNKIIASPQEKGG